MDAAEQAAEGRFGRRKVIAWLKTYGLGIGLVALAWRATVVWDLLAAA